MNKCIDIFIFEGEEKAEQKRNKNKQKIDS